jgi:hypothetical protein
MVWHFMILPIPKFGIFYFLGPGNPGAPMWLKKYMIQELKIKKWRDRYSYFQIDKGMKEM